MSEELTGRRLDAEVAERVMGWLRIDQQEPFRYHVERGGVIIEDADGWLDAQKFNRGVIPDPWRPSTDPAAAKDVREEMERRGFCWMLIFQPSQGRYVATFGQFRAFGATEELATTRAALAALAGSRLTPAPTAHTPPR
jgi:hypothetical protein